MVRVTLPLGVVAVLLAASAAVGQTPQLIVEPPRFAPRLTPQPQTVEPPTASQPQQPAKSPVPEPVVIEEAPSDFYPPVPSSSPAPSGQKHRWFHRNETPVAPGNAMPYPPGPYGPNGVVEGFAPSPYAPPPTPASGHKHRWKHSCPDNGVGDPVLYGNAEFAEGSYYTPVGPPPPPNGTGKKHRWKHGNPDLSYYPIPGAEMTDDGLNAFTDPNCLKKKHHLLHGLMHKHHAAKPAPPPAPVPPQPCLEDGTAFPIDE